MELYTTATREMTPPVILTHCPGGGGHLWARLNPRWHSDTRATPREEMWCLEHEAEKKAHIHKAISEEQQQRMAKYAELPLPMTKRCTNPDPTTHKPGAVLPRGKFYRRKGPKKLNGEHSEILDSRCKACIRAASKARREADVDEARRKRRQSENNRRSRLAREREKLARQRDTLLPAAPFREWLTEYVETTGVQYKKLARGARIDESTVRSCLKPQKATVQMGVVDKVGVSTGHVDLVTSLYGGGGEGTLIA